ncbi:hypothetical protein PsYK624_143950 [Phanerochaete sordida]|uniref:Uncharacterized protein n=1 Tax=Phanerochaete sordida TaxID=48140 RepID=A0A9P3LK59_9APHY|nr:hypothetical protein PsYK624_143950 [Phanerochaete sordida]
MSDTHYPPPPASPPPPSYHTLDDDDDDDARVPSPTSTISGTSWLLAQRADSVASTDTLSTLSGSSADTYAASLHRSASCTSVNTSASCTSGASAHTCVSDAALHRSVSGTSVKTLASGTSAASAAPAAGQPPWHGTGGGVVVARQACPAHAGEGDTTYTFAHAAPGTLFLLPTDAPGAAPLYHIAAAPNCFCPASHVTAVRRGSEHGAFVGEFEIGQGPAAARMNRVVLGAHAGALAAPAVYWEHHPVCPLPRLRWNFGGAALRWDPARAKGRVYFKCTAPDPRRKKVVHAVASFWPPDPARAVEGVRPAAVLRVERGWEQVMDHVLLSVLMLQQEPRVKG